MRRALAAGISAALALWAAPVCAQLGPDDGPDIILSGTGGPDWLIVCEGRTIYGDLLRGAAGGPRAAPAPEARFDRVGYLRCDLHASSAPAVFRVEKIGGQPFCPFGGPDPRDCFTRLGPGQSAAFEFEAVP